jgi:hypothetical protein
MSPLLSSLNKRSCLNRAEPEVGEELVKGVPEVVRHEADVEESDGRVGCESMSTVYMYLLCNYASKSRTIYLLN